MVEGARLESGYTVMSGIVGSNPIPSAITQKLAATTLRFSDLRGRQLSAPLPATHRQTSNLPVQA